MERSAGILMPLSALPGRHGIGSFSKEAYGFVDFLKASGQSYWQILPLSPPNHSRSKDTPYQSYSVFAGNPNYISLDALVEEGVLTRAEVDAAAFGTGPGRVDYDLLYRNRLPLLRRAYERARVAENGDYLRFIRDNAWWLDDYALFMALKGFFEDREWPDWPEDIRRRWGFALDHYNQALYFDVEFHKYTQFVFFRQWSALKEYANAQGIRIVGDIAIYVSLDSADVWVHPELFQLDDSFRQTAVAGCPPDAFAEDGQIWGTPLYNWEAHRRTGYDWWMARLWSNFRMCDLLRIDHFRGLDEYFSIPAGAKTAADGHWEPGPGMELFRRMRDSIGQKPVIVEDLGFMTDSVRALVRETGFPNMKVLEFGFDPEDEGAVNDYLPHNIPEHCVVYTGTHDNDPVNGWFAALSGREKAMIRRYFGCEDLPDGRMNGVFIRAAMMSRAERCIIPLQDWLGLGHEARFNEPARLENNWHWRLQPGALTEEVCARIRETTRMYGRLNWGD